MCVYNSWGLEEEMEYKNITVTPEAFDAGY